MALSLAGIVRAGSAGVDADADIHRQQQQPSVKDQDIQQKGADTFTCSMIVLEGICTALIYLSLSCSCPAAVNVFQLCLLLLQVSLQTEPS